MVAIYVVAGLCIVGMLLIAVISMFGGGGNSGSAALAQERMERRQAKLDQQESGDQQDSDDQQKSGDQQETGDAAAPTPLPSSSRRAYDDAA